MFWVQPQDVGCPFLLPLNLEETAARIQEDSAVWRSWGDLGLV